MHSASTAVPTPSPGASLPESAGGTGMLPEWSRRNTVEKEPLCHSRGSCLVDLQTVTVKDSGRGMWAQPGGHLTCPPPRVGHRTTDW